MTVAASATWRSDPPIAAHSSLARIVSSAVARHTSTSRARSGSRRPNSVRLNGPSRVTPTSMKEVKKRRRRSSRISSKHQVTIPVDALRAAGLEVGESVVARVDGPGRVVLERETDVIDAFAGSLTGTYDRDELAQLRGEWA